MKIRAKCLNSHGNRSMFFNSGQKRPLPTESRRGISGNNNEKKQRFAR